MGMSLKKMVWFISEYQLHFLLLLQYGGFGHCWDSKISFGNFVYILSLTWSQKQTLLGTLRMAQYVATEVVVVVPEF
jgi:hypothetical protein